MMMMKQALLFIIHFCSTNKKMTKKLFRRSIHAKIMIDNVWFQISQYKRFCVGVSLTTKSYFFCAGEVV